MFNKYLYSSEKEAVQREMRVSLEKYGQIVVDFYLAKGFDNLALALNLPDDFQRRIVFDYLMLDKKVLLDCLKQNKAFFLKMIIDGKGEMIRPMLGLKSKKYNKLWLEALDLLNLYFVERKIDEKLSNLSLENFFENSMLNEQKRKDENLSS